jgi:hypothetical protein
VGETVDGAALATRMTDAMVKAASGTFTMDLGSQGSSTGAFAMRGGSMDQRMTMSVEGHPMEIVSTGGAIYMKGVPGSTKPWVKIDPRANDPVSTMVAGMAGDMGDPRQLAKALKGSKATVVSSSGEAVVYDVTIDPATLLGDASAAAGSSVKARYTLDREGLPVTMTVQAQGETVRITFSGWGTPVSIGAPPADQVGPFQIPSS